MYPKHHGKNKYMVNDPIGDMLIQIKNAAMSGKRVVQLPFSKLKMNVAETLVKEKYLNSAEKVGTAPKFELKLTIGYHDDSPIMTDVKRRSKPGLRVYVDRQSIPKVVGGMGIAVLSTSKGIMTGEEARKKGLGGELLCEIW